MEEERGWRNKRVVNVFSLSTQLDGLPALMNSEEFYTNWNWFSRTVFQKPAQKGFLVASGGPFLHGRRAQSAASLKGLRRTNSPIPLQGELGEMQVGGLPKKGDCGGTPRPVGWGDGDLQSCWVLSAAKVSCAIS